MIIQITVHVPEQLWKIWLEGICFGKITHDNLTTFVILQRSIQHYIKNVNLGFKVLGSVCIRSEKVQEPQQINITSWSLKFSVSTTKILWTSCLRCSTKWSLKSRQIGNKIWCLSFHAEGLTHPLKTFLVLRSLILLKQTYSSFSHLDEGISSSIVCDSEAQRIFRLCHLHFFGFSPNVSEDEVFQSNLTPQELLHVHFMGVKGAEEDLKGTVGK